ncbi:MAG: hypothetical protein AUG51_02850 [Acidobacteria bacterium 13_1_20CM_3_53_8]|nr:MAG: hypothetical protein AUG51_02850 [Acidobacteria bacterium 13_1_20CM_3_53_8]
MTGGGKTKTHNRLWFARKRSGLQQKQIAALLNHQTVDQVSRYEKGLRIPNLETALCLEIIFGIPIRVLLPDLYKQLEDDIRQKIASSPSLKRIFDQAEQSGFEAYCPYAELLRKLSPTPTDLDRVRKHIIQLSNKLTEFFTKKL